MIFRLAFGNKTDDKLIRLQLNLYLQLHELQRITKSILENEMFLKGS